MKVFFTGTDSSIRVIAASAAFVWFSTNDSNGAGRFDILVKAKENRQVFSKCEPSHKCKQKKRKKKFETNANKKFKTKVWVNTNKKNKTNPLRMF